MGILATETSTPTTDTPAFEVEEASAPVAAPTPAQAAIAAAVKQEQARVAANTAARAESAPVPAKVAGGAGALQTLSANPMEALKNALPVDFNTLSAIKAEQGNLLDRETNTVLGDQLTGEILSWQDSWVVSPNSESAPKETVKFSNDGMVCTDGTGVPEHLAYLKEIGYKQAKVVQRAVVVLAVESAAKTDKFNGTLVQIDLAPTSRTQFLRYATNMAFAASKGTLDPSRVGKVRVNTRLASANGKSWTLVEWSQA